MSTEKQNLPEDDPQEKGGLGGLIDKTVTSSYEDILAIIDARMELIKIEITEKIALAASLLIIAVLLISGIVYLITTIALLIGELLGHYYLGYLIVSAFFLLLFLLFAKIRPDLLKNIIHSMLLSSHDKQD